MTQVSVAVPEPLRSSTDSDQSLHWDAFCPRSQIQPNTLSKVQSFLKESSDKSKSRARSPFSNYLKTTNVQEPCFKSQEPVDNRTLFPLNKDAFDTDSLDGNNCSDSIPEERRPYSEASFSSIEHKSVTNSSVQSSQPLASPTTSQPPHKPETTIHRITVKKNVNNIASSKRRWKSAERLSQSRVTRRKQIDDLTNVNLHNKHIDDDSIVIEETVITKTLWKTPHDISLSDLHKEERPAVYQLRSALSADELDCADEYPSEKPLLITTYWYPNSNIPPVSRLIQPSDMPVSARYPGKITPTSIYHPTAVRQAENKENKGNASRDSQRSQKGHLRSLSTGHPAKDDTSKVMSHAPINRQIPLLTRASVRDDKKKEWYKDMFNNMNPYRPENLSKSQPMSLNSVSTQSNHSDVQSPEEYDENDKPSKIPPYPEMFNEGPENQANKRTELKIKLKYKDNGAPISPNIPDPPLRNCKVSSSAFETRSQERPSSLNKPSRYQETSVPLDKPLHIRTKESSPTPQKGLLSSGRENNQLNHRDKKSLSPSPNFNDSISGPENFKKTKNFFNTDNSDQIDSVPLRGRQRQKSNNNRGSVVNSLRDKFQSEDSSPVTPTKSLTSLNDRPKKWNLSSCDEDFIKRRQYRYTVRGNGSTPENTKRSKSFSAHDRNPIQKPENKTVFKSKPNEKVSTLINFYSNIDIWKTPQRAASPERHINNMDTNGSSPDEHIVTKVLSKSLEFIDSPLEEKKGLFDKNTDERKSLENIDSADNAESGDNNESIDNVYQNAFSDSSVLTIVEPGNDDNQNKDDTLLGVEIDDLCDNPEIFNENENISNNLGEEPVPMKQQPERENSKNALDLLLNSAPKPYVKSQKENIPDFYSLSPSSIPETKDSVNNSEHFHQSDEIETSPHFEHNNPYHEQHNTVIKHESNSRFSYYPLSGRTYKLQNNSQSDAEEIRSTPEDPAFIVSTTQKRTEEKITNIEAVESEKCQMEINDNIRAYAKRLHEIHDNCYNKDADKTLSVKLKLSDQKPSVSSSDENDSAPLPVKKKYKKTGNVSQRRKRGFSQNKYSNNNQAKKDNPIREKSRSCDALTQSNDSSFSFSNSNSYPNLNMSDCNFENLTFQRSKPQEKDVSTKATRPNTLPLSDSGVDLDFGSSTTPMPAGNDDYSKSSLISPSDHLKSPTQVVPNAERFEIRSKKGLVLYDFHAITEKELDLKKGDICVIAKSIDKNWFLGSHESRHGIFPQKYVQLIPEEEVSSISASSELLSTSAEKEYFKSPPIKHGKVKYNFLSQTPYELELKKGEIVNIVKRVDSNWYEGFIDGRKGIFPVLYVEEIQLPLNDEKPTMISSSESLKKISTNDIGQTKNFYKVLYPYKPLNTDELELVEDDNINVIEMCQDGWYVGISSKSGAFGTFPGNYVTKQ